MTPEVSPNLSDVIQKTREEKRKALGELNELVRSSEKLIEDSVAVLSRYGRKETWSEREKKHRVAFALRDVDGHGAPLRVPRDFECFVVDAQVPIGDNDKFQISIVSSGNERPENASSILIYAPEIIDGAVMISKKDKGGMTIRSVENGANASADAFLDRIGFLSQAVGLLKNHLAAPQAA